MCHNVLPQGADPFAKNDHQQTPLYTAVEAKQTAAVQCLCQACPSTVNTADEWQLCPLHIAARAGDVNIVTLLLLAQVLLVFASLAMTGMSARSSRSYTIPVTNQANDLCFMCILCLMCFVCLVQQSSHLVHSVPAIL